MIFKQKEYLTFINSHALYDLKTLTSVLYN